MSKPLNIGIVGLGSICKERHLPGLRKIPNVHVTTVVNRTRESSEAAARAHDIANVADSWEALVAQEDLDAVLIGTWPYLHRDVSIAAFERGKHVFCQARMAMDAAQAREMHAAWRKSGKVGMVCPAPFGLSVDATVRRLLRDGTLGDMRLARVQSFSAIYADPDAPMNWRKDHRLSGLNMGMLGMYIEVLHRWFGPAEAVTGAQHDTYVATRKDSAGHAVDVKIPDQILFHARMPDDVPAQFVFNTAVHHGTDRFILFGSEATLRYDVFDDRLYMARKDAREFEPVTIREEDVYDVTNWRVEQDFVDAIREGADYYPSFEHGLQYMEVIQAVYTAAAQKRAVDIPRTWQK